MKEKLTCLFREAVVGYVLRKQCYGLVDVFIGGAQGIGDLCCPSRDGRRASVRAFLDGFDELFRIDDDGWSGGLGSGSALVLGG